MVLLELVPILLGVHLLDLLTQPSVLILQNLKPLEKPLEFAQHIVAFLLPKGSCNLVLIVPLSLLLRIHIEFAVIVVADCHLSLSPLRQKLGISVYGLLYVQSWGLDQGDGLIHVN